MQTSDFTVRNLLVYATPYRYGLALAGLLQIAETAALLLIPAVGGQFLGAVLAPSGLDLNAALLLLLALFFVQTALQLANGYVLSGTSEKILADLRVRVYDHLQALPLSFHEGRRRGAVLSLLTNDVARLSEFMTGTLLNTVPLLLVLAGATIQMYRIDARLALAVAVLMPAFVIGLKLIGRRLRPLSSRLRDEEAKSMALVEENLAMLPAIKAFAREELELRRHAGQTASVMALSLTQQRIYAALQPVARCITACALVLLLWFVSGRPGEAKLSPGELATFLLYAALLAGPISALASVYGQTQMVRGALQRLHESLGEAVEPLVRQGHAFGRAHGKITFRDVGFAYPGGTTVLNGFSLDIAAGETVALTGVNGAGKSTLVNLLLRLRQPDRGGIYIDGIDLSGVDVRSLRRQIGLVPQNILLLNASISDNIGYANPAASPQAIEAAARAAQAHAFIARLPAGYRTIIGDNGVRLSGGQRQRIALARALLKDPPILVLDEATAMFDPDAERSFIEDCHDQLARRTVILITHRPASLALADRVLRLDNGRIEDARTHVRQADTSTAP